jgi:sugar lactone lactonase YvrE
MYEGGKVIKLSQSAEVLEEIHLPTKYPTMPCLGGPDGKTLFITTAAPKNDPGISSDPYAGKIFLSEVDVPGCSVNFFA